MGRKKEKKRKNKKRKEKTKEKGGGGMEEVSPEAGSGRMCRSSGKWEVRGEREKKKAKIEKRDERGIEERRRRR